MPITPHHVVLSSWADADEYADIPIHEATECNRRIRRHCSEAFVMRRNALNRSWLDQKPLRSFVTMRNIEPTAEAPTND